MENTKTNISRTHTRNHSKSKEENSDSKQISQSNITITNSARTTSAKNNKSYQAISHTKATSLSSSEKGIAKSQKSEVNGNTIVINSPIKDRDEKLNVPGNH